MHVSIQEGTSLPIYERCGTCCQKYHCPFCSVAHYKPSAAGKLRGHLKSHFNRAVQHKGYTIHRCGLGCRTQLHYHCIYCQSMLLRKDDFENHLIVCKTKILTKKTPSKPFPPSTEVHFHSTEPPLPSTEVRFPDAEAHPPSTEPPLPSTKSYPPGTESQPHGTELYPLTTEPSLLSTELHPPTTKPHSTSSEVRFSSAEPHPTTTEPHPTSTEVRFPIAELHPPSSEPHSTSTVVCFPSTELPLPSAELHTPSTHPSTTEPHPPSTPPHPPSTEVRFLSIEPHPPSTEVRFLSIEPHPPSTEVRFLSAELHPPSAEPHPTSTAMRFPSAESHPPSTLPYPPSAELHPPITLLCPTVIEPNPPSAKPAERRTQTLTGRARVRPIVRQKCPLCNVLMNKCNIKKHMDRKHTHLQLFDVNSKYHLKSECIDEVNGVFSIQKTFHIHSGPPASESGNEQREMEHHGGAPEGVMPTQSLENNDMIRNIRAGVEWLEKNQHLLKNKCMTPQILFMEEDDALKALAQLHAHCTALLNKEIRAPFYFTFKNMEDMELFMSEVWDKRSVKVSSFFNPSI